MNLSQVILDLTENHDFCENISFDRDILRFLVLNLSGQISESIKFILEIYMRSPSIVLIAYISKFYTVMNKDQR